jgi:hypothetical protein
MRIWRIRERSIRERDGGVEIGNLPGTDPGSRAVKSK